jgi:hypothetical protein
VGCELLLLPAVTVLPWDDDGQLLMVRDAATHNGSRVWPITFGTWQGGRRWMVNESVCALPLAAVATDVIAATTTAARAAILRMVTRVGPGSVPTALPLSPRAITA